MSKARRTISLCYVADNTSLQCIKACDAIAAILLQSQAMTRGTRNESMAFLILEALCCWTGFVSL